MEQAPMSGAVSNALVDLIGVPFEMARITTASIVYKSEGKLGHLTDRELKDSLARIVPSAREADLCTAEPRTFYAERYGGQGIGIHEGGARCGLDRDSGLQVKGGGANPLRNPDAPPGYSHGGLSLAECIQELLWSEVFMIALPYGAVKCPAVIATGTQCWWVTERWSEDELAPRYGRPPRIPRGLFVREFALRPGHFMRAVRPSRYRTTSSAQEIERLTKLVRIIPDALADQGILDSGQGLRYQLVEVAKRFARQSSAAMAKCLVHGAISPSNICLDGRWIDFGSSTSIPTFGDPIGYPPVLNDVPLYLTIFDELALNISKYGASRSDMVYSDLLQAMTASYIEEVEHCRAARVLALCGYPLPMCEQLLNDSAGVAFVAAAKRLINVGAGRFVSAHPDDHDSFALYDVKQIIKCLVVCRGEGQRISELQRLLGSDSLQRDLFSTFTRLNERAMQLASADGLSPKSFECVVRLNCAAVTRKATVLYREKLVSVTEALASTDSMAWPGAVDELLNLVRRDARLQFEDRTTWCSPIWAQDGNECRYDARADLIRCTKPGSDVERWRIHDAMRMGLMGAASAAIADWWGDDIMRCLI